MAHPQDPRFYQIATLSTLLVYGMTQLEFDVTPGRCALLITTALATQALASRRVGIPFDPLSALISSLSLCLLLRTNHASLAMLTAVVAVGSKFVIRINGKHVFNPTNLGIVFALATGYAWVSPGQWGSAAFFAFFMACVGGVVTNRSSRTDVTIAALTAWAALLFARSAWLGEPIDIPVHRIQSGAFLLFAFFMISDPKTTPDSRLGRVLFATVVCFGAAVVQFKWFRTNGLVWSLALFSMFVPLVDRLLPGGKFQWPTLPERTPAPTGLAEVS